MWSYWGSLGLSMCCHVWNKNIPVAGHFVKFSTQIPSVLILKKIYRSLSNHGSLCSRPQCPTPRSSKYVLIEWLLTVDDKFHKGLVMNWSTIGVDSKVKIKSKKYWIGQFWPHKSCKGSIGMPGCHGLVRLRWRYPFCHWRHAILLSPS